MHNQLEQHQQQQSADYSSLLFDIFRQQQQKPEQTSASSSTITTATGIVRVNLFDLKSDLTPTNAYSGFQCVKSLKIYVATTLCVYDPKNDVHVSRSIASEGVWERELITIFMNYLNENPHWLVLDVGAQIGQYSLFAAKLNRTVVAVEPFIDNIYRLHKASKAERIENRIVLLQNALSNKRNEIKLLDESNRNIGGQSLLTNKRKVYQEKDKKSNKYLVETILFDDLVAYLPKREDGADFKQAILKIDIEGFEPYAFQNASKLFKKLDIRVIFMEWGNLPSQQDSLVEIESMLEFLIIREYLPFDALTDKRLDPIAWSHWPWDIIWKKTMMMTNDEII